MKQFKIVRFKVIDYFISSFYAISDIKVKYYQQISKYYAYFIYYKNISNDNFTRDFKEIIITIVVHSNFESKL